MFVALKGDVDTSWREYTLLLPAVSIGNVGQLAIDLVISALSSSCQLIGYFHDASLLPAVGNDAFAKSGFQCGKLNLSAEVYKSEEHKLVIVQKRSPVAKGYQSLYCKRLVEWIKYCCYDRVIMLSSVSATDRVDSQIKGSPLRYLTSKASGPLQSHFDKLSWIPLEKKPLHKAGQTEDEQYSMPGGGITNKFFDACLQEHLPLTILMTFCSEGENIADAVQLFLYLNEWLSLIEKNKVESMFAGKPSDFFIPLSWSLMFGSPVARQSLF